MDPANIVANLSAYSSGSIFFNHGLLSGNFDVFLGIAVSTGRIIRGGR